MPPVLTGQLGVAALGSLQLGALAVWDVDHPTQHVTAADSATGVGSTMSASLAVSSFAGDAPRSSLSVNHPRSTISVSGAKGEIE
jgi:hypothetical protein